MADDNPITAAIQALQGHAQNAAKPERVEPGPGDVMPSTETKGVDSSDPAALKKVLVTLPMEPDEITQWWGRVERARQRVKAREGQWDLLLNEYLPIVTKSGEAETVRLQRHFRNVHTKIGQLFYRSPDLIMTAKDPSPAQNQKPNPMAAMLPPGAPQPPPITMEDIISVKQAVLNEKLGRDGIKVSRLYDELLFDVLAWAGIGCSKLGYRCVTKTIQRPKMQPAPAPAAPPQAPGSILGLSTPTPAAPLPPQPVMGPDGQPVMEAVPVPIYEEWYDRRFSPKKALWNDDLRSTRFDEDATWMGMEFFMAPQKAMRAFGLTEEEASKAAEDDRVHPYGEDQQGTLAKTQLLHGVEIFCKASMFTDEVHPQAINQLVLIEGIPDKVLVWRPSPDQSFDAEGKLTQDSLIGFPIRVLTIRDLADSPFPPSDSAFTNSGIKQLSTWRRQSIRIRDAAIGKYFYDMDAFDTEEVDILKNGEVGAYIGVMGGKLANGADKVFTTSAQIHATNDDYRGQEILSHDVDDTLGISSVQAGIPESTIHSATEVATVRNSSQSRNDKELSRVIDHYLDTARMIDQLLMRYADQQEYITITGESGEKRMMVWNNELISGKYLYDIAPDSQLREDTAKDFQLTLNFYNQAAKDPLFNRSYVLRKLARQRGMDPAKVVLPAPPVQEHKPEPPKVSISISADLADPLQVAILEQLGLIGNTQNKPAPGVGGAGGGSQHPAHPGVPQPSRLSFQPPHGGANTPGETISQHAASNSGNRPSEPGAVDHRATQVK